MPVYEYECLDCGGRFSKLMRSLAQPQTIVCPTCEGTHTRKLVSTFAAHGLDSHVDHYTGGDNSDLPRATPPVFGRPELQARSSQGAG